jgi:hypothetical protein
MEQSQHGVEFAAIPITERRKTNRTQSQQSYDWRQTRHPGEPKNSHPLRNPSFPLKSGTPTQPICHRRPAQTLEHDAPPRPPPDLP